MKIAGIIAEYNPFHNGHLLQIEATRAAGAGAIVAVMGGNWLQRGAPALCRKQARARAALLSGADLVLELPLPYAAATAERFAFGGVEVLAGLGCVDLLSFGSEAGDLSLLSACAAGAQISSLPPGAGAYPPAGLALILPQPGLFPQGLSRRWCG